MITSATHWQPSLDNDDIVTGFADVEQAIDNIQAAMKRTEDYLREAQL
jgi:hypothetical protein